MSPETRSEIVQILEGSRNDFVEAVRGVTEAQAQAHPQAGRWSVLECVEHVTTVEVRFLGRLENAPREGAPPLDKEKESALQARVQSRANRAEAPEPVRPTGRFSTLGAALAAFQAARDCTVRFAERESAALYQRAESHPRFGPLNGMELLIIMAGHARRHAEQIRELKAALGQA
ncbi:MAG TPA: DinB family protein [Bryobacteraceae bacterium]|nr:DinB family protein [Bryobacteraceae bacterium]